MTMYELIERRKLSGANVTSCAVYLGERLVSVITEDKFSLIEIDEYMCQLRLTGLERYYNDNICSTSYFINFDKLIFSVSYNPKDDETSNN